MCKSKMILLNLFFIFFFSSLLLAKEESKSHLTLKSRYPFSLLTKDYGILSSDDFQINSCIAKPTRFTEDSISYPYWQCLPVKSVSFICDSKNVDGAYSSSETIMYLEVKPPEEKAIYLARRAIEYNRCRWFKKRWRQITYKEPYVCLSGAQFGLSSEDDGTLVRTWNFDKFKTKKGCESYFEGYCDLKYFKKHKMCKP